MILIKDKNIILITILLGLVILGSAYGFVLSNNSNNKDKNTTIENISNNKTIENQNNTTENNTTKTSTNTKKTSKKSGTKSSSSYGVGSSAVDSNGYTKNPPDDSGNWVIVGGKWEHAVTYKNGHYYDYHGDNVDHKMT